MTTNALISRLTPEQRASLPGEWFEQTCGACNGNGCHKGFDASGKWTNLHCFRCHGTGKNKGEHPDITDPANLAALLMVCDSVAGDDSQIIEKCPQAIPSMVHRHTICHGRERDWFEATGPTRTAAALAALDKALGVEA